MCVEGFPQIGMLICGFCCKFVVRMVGKGLENSTGYYGKYRQ